MFCLVALSGRCNRASGTRDLLNVHYCIDSIITSSIAHRAKRTPVFKLLSSRAILRFFAPQGRHVAPMGVKFGTEEWTKVPTFTPYRCNDKGIGPQQLKILLKFYQMSEHKRPARAYPLAIFTKFAQSVPRFSVR